MTQVLYTGTLKHLYAVVLEAEACRYVNFFSRYVVLIGLKFKVFV